MRTSTTRDAGRSIRIALWPTLALFALVATGCATRLSRSGPMADANAGASDELRSCTYVDRCGRVVRVVRRCPPLEVAVPARAPAPPARSIPEPLPAQASVPVPPPAPEPTNVRVAVSETVGHPDLSEFPVHVEVSATGNDGEPRGEVRAALERELLRRGIHVVSREDAVLGVIAEGKTAKGLDLGANRTQVKGRGAVELLRADDGTRLLHETFEEGSGADATEATAVSALLASLGTDAGRAVAAAVRRQASGIRVRTVHLAAADDSVTAEEITAPLVDGLLAEAYVLAVRPAGTGTGGVSGRGPSLRLEVWLAPGFEDSLAEVVESILAAGGEGQELNYAVESVK